MLHVLVRAGHDQADDEVAKGHGQTEEAAHPSGPCDQNEGALIHHAPYGTEQRGESGGFDPVADFQMPDDAGPIAGLSVVIDADLRSTRGVNMAFNAFNSFINSPLT